jgi:hypothetical protein
MRTLLLMMTLAAGSAADSSCDLVRFKHPLVEPGQAAADPRLLGAWAGRIGDTECLLRFAPRKDGELDVAVISASSDDGAVQLAYQGFPATVGGQTFLNLREKHYTSAYDNKYQLDPAYVIERLDFEPGGAFALFSVTQGTLGDEVKGKALHVQGKGKSLLVTEGAAALAAWLAKPGAATAFKRSGHFAPIKVDYGPAPPANP